MIYLFELVRAADGVTTPSEIVTPYLPVVGVVLGGIIVGLFTSYNRRKGNVETRAPDVNEIWNQERQVSMELDKERKWRRRIENFSWELTRTFRGYVNRVQAGGDMKLTHHEKLIYDSDPPTSEINVKGGV